jgi:hypothetical protein
MVSQAIYLRTVPTDEHTSMTFVNLRFEANEN